MDSTSVETLANFLRLVLDAMFNGGFEKGVGFRDCVGFYKKLLNMFNFYRWRLGSSFVAMVVFFFYRMTMTCLVCIYRRRSNNRKEDVVVRRDGPGAARWCSVYASM